LKEQEFDKAWELAINRFKILVGMKSFGINLKHPDTKKPIKPHEAIPEVFQEWQKIKSTWDRNLLIFDTFYHIANQHMKPWQIANYLTISRNAFEALNLMKNFIQEDIDNPDRGEFFAALAKALMALTYHHDALLWAQRASKIEPDNSHFQLILADAYFLCGQSEKAHAIYSSQMATLTPSDNPSIPDLFSNFFSLETGVVPSPIFAFQIGQSLTDANQAEEFWQLGEAEFYHSPHFRMQHAYYLASTGRLKHCFAKLLALVQEMPWVQEANMNLLRLFEHFDPSGTNIMPEFQAEVRKRVADNGWTTEGMEEIIFETE